MELVDSVHLLDYVSGGKTGIRGTADNATTPCIHEIRSNSAWLRLEDLISDRWGGVLPATVSHVRCLRGISMPYARSLPRATMSHVNKVPGNPTMNVTIFQKVVPVACARIPVKLKFAKIQTADTPPSVPVGVEVPWAAAH